MSDIIHDESDDGRAWGYVTDDGVWHALPKTPLLLAGFGPPPFDVELPTGEIRRVVHNPAERTPMLTLNRDNVERLAHSILEAIKQNYQSSETSPARTLEALNALGQIAALLIKGTGYDPEAIKFFQDAVNLEPMIGPKESADG